MPSRIGKQPIKINDKVKVEISKSEIKVTGPLGEIILTIFDHISVQKIDSQIICKIIGSDIPSKRAMQGLLRNLISNAVVGVSEGWQKKLDLVNVPKSGSCGGSCGSSKCSASVGGSCGCGGIK